jgi:hypothetical protein
LPEGSRAGPSADDTTDVLVDISSSPGNLPFSRDSLPFIIKAFVLVISRVYLSEVSNGFISLCYLSSVPRVLVPLYEINAYSSTRPVEDCIGCTSRGHRTRMFLSFAARGEELP